MSKRLVLSESAPRVKIVKAFKVSFWLYDSGLGYPLLYTFKTVAEKEATGAIVAAAIFGADNIRKPYRIIETEDQLGWNKLPPFDLKGKLAERR